MCTPITRLFLYSYPDLVGGAGTELYHQIRLWLKMGIEIHFIPAFADFETAPRFREMLDMGCIFHGHNDWSALQPGDPVFSFCEWKIFRHLPAIRQKTRRVIFVNCMSGASEEEYAAMERGEIAMFLYQNEEIRRQVMPILKGFNDNPAIQFLTFKPYFDFDLFPFIQTRSDHHFTAGRVSRADPWKYSPHTIDIYENFVSPKPKQGIFLGYHEECEKKIGGKPPQWITVESNPLALTPREVYEQSHIILFPSDTDENLPRVGFEAMASGSVLIVDNRLGWRQLVTHGVTGWLCDAPSDFKYYASKMAYEPDLRLKIAQKARQWAEEIAGFETSRASWLHIFDTLAMMPR